MIFSSAFLTSNAQLRGYVSTVWNGFDCLSKFIIVKMAFDLFFKFFILKFVPLALPFFSGDF